MCFWWPLALSIIQFSKIIFFVLYFFPENSDLKTASDFAQVQYFLSVHQRVHFGLSHFWHQKICKNRNWTFFSVKEHVGFVSFLMWKCSAVSSVHYYCYYPCNSLLVKNPICLEWLIELAYTCFFQNLVQKRGTRPLPRTVSSPPIPPRVGWSHSGALSSKYTTSTKAGVQLQAKQPQIKMEIRCNEKMFEDELGFSTHWLSSHYMYFHHPEFTFIEAEYEDILHLAMLFVLTPIRMAKNGNYIFSFKVKCC